MRVSHPSLGDHEKSVEGDQAECEKAELGLQSLDERLEMLADDSPDDLFARSLSLKAGSPIIKAASLQQK